MMRLARKVALISGGAKGMGATEAVLFAQEGARVVIGDILEAEGRKTEAEINESGGECIFVKLDVTSETEWQSAVQAAVERFGKLDILVNNAGITATGIIEDLPEEDWDRVMGINVKGGLLRHQACHTCHERCGRRLDSEHLFWCGYSASTRYIGRIRCFERRRTDLQQIHGCPIRPRKYPVQFRASRAGGNRYAGFDWAGRPNRDDWPSALESGGYPNGDSIRSTLPGFR